MTDSAAPGSSRTYRPSSPKRFDARARNDRPCDRSCSGTSPYSDRSGEKSPPSSRRPIAAAIASVTVDLPGPLSRASSVTGASRSSFSIASVRCATPAAAAMWLCRAMEATADRRTGELGSYAGAVLVAAVVAALAITGAGVAIVWTRFSAAGLSGFDVVRRVGPLELFGVGASYVLVLALAAAVAVGLAFLIARKGTPLRQAVLATLLALAGVLVAIVVFNDADPAPRVVAAALTVLAGVAAVVVALATTRNRLHRWLQRHGRAAAVGASVAVLLVAGGLFVAGEWLAAGTVLAVGVVAAVPLGLALTPQQPHRSALRRICRWLGAGVRSLAGPGAVVVLAVAVGVLLGSRAVGALVLLAGALVAVLMNAVRRGFRFRWYAQWVIGAVGVFGAALVALHTWEQPQLRPTAVVRSDGSGVAGFLVAGTGRSVHVGTARHCRRDARRVLVPGRALPGSGNVTAVPRTEIRAQRTGRATSLPRALAAAPVLLNEARSEAGFAPLPLNGPCSGEGKVDDRKRLARPVPPAEAAALAERYRPVLRFDSLELWRPLNIDRLFAERRGGDAAHRVCSDPRACDALTGGTQLEGRAAGFLDLSGQVLEGRDAAGPDLASCPGDQPSRLQDCDGGPRSAMYYRAVRANDRVYVDYWWFLRYNHFGGSGAPELCRNRASSAIKGLGCNEHEGDWEGVTAVTAAGDPRTLEFVGYAQHTVVLRYRAQDLHREGERPVVYVAEGSHASYADDCPVKCQQYEFLLLGRRRPEANTNGANGWARNDRRACKRGASCLLPLPDRSSWNAFGGLWGSPTCVAPGGRACQLGAAPQTPSHQPRYRYPWCYTDRHTRKLACDPVGS